MLQQNLWGGDGRENGPETRDNKGRGCTMPFFFITEIFYRRESNSWEWMKLSEEHFITFISTVASPHGHNLKPLRKLLFLLCTNAGWVCVLQSHAYRSPPQATWLVKEPIRTERRWNALFTQNLACLPSDFRNDSKVWFVRLYMT
jgi:hypothetical protein